MMVLIPEDYVVAGVANLRRSLERQLDHPRGERLDLLLEEVDRLAVSLLMALWQ